MDVKAWVRGWMGWGEGWVKGRVVSLTPLSIFPSVMRSVMTLTRCTTRQQTVEGMRGWVGWVRYRA